MCQGGGGPARGHLWTGRRLLSVEKTGGELILHVVSACCLHLFVKMSEVGDFVLFFTIKRKKAFSPFCRGGVLFFYGCVIVNG